MIKMWKYLHLISLYFLLENCDLTWQFLMSGEEELMIVPSVAFRHHPQTMSLTVNAQPRDDWILFAQGWYFEENPFRSLLATSLLSTTVDNIDHKRVTYFTGSGKRYKPLCIDGLQHEMCTKTDTHGLIEKQFQVTNEEIEQFRVPGGSGGKVEYSVSTPRKTLQAKGEIFLCDDNGISIISDIVKISPK